MRENRKETPELTQEQAGSTLERIYNACRLPFDREAYDALSKKARKGRLLRLIALVGLIAIAAIIILGVLGVFTTEYIRHVVVRSPQTTAGPRPPAATSAWIEENEVVLQLEAGEYPIDYGRITAAEQGSGRSAAVSADAESGRLRLPCPARDTVFEITVYDTQGMDYLILATYTAGS